MLSFFRSKSSETSVDKIVTGTKELSLQVDESPIDVVNMQSISHDNTNESLQSLGYQNEIELRETIYGTYSFVAFFFCLNSCGFHIFVN